MKDLKKQTTAALLELDLTDPAQRVIAQVGILLIQMLRLGFSAKHKPTYKPHPLISSARERS
jgi:hypothetical protein